MANRYSAVSYNRDGQCVMLVVEDRDDGEHPRVIATCTASQVAIEIAEAMGAKAVADDARRLEERYAEAQRMLTSDEQLHRVAAARSHLSNGHADSALVERG